MLPPASPQPRPSQSGAGAPRPAADPAPPRTGNRYRLSNIVAASLRHARRVIVLVIGSTVLALGAALIVLPGPAFVVIPVGLAILATEFEWARRWLHGIKDGARNFIDPERNPFRDWRRWFRVSR